jgi:predicted lipoprotein with Yx(FWY)xxD motif
MHRTTALAGVALAAAFGVAACGSSDPRPPAQTSSSTVAVRDVGSVGATLVDGSGRTLYFADQEASGAIKCVDACLRFWQPLTVDAGSQPTASGDLSGKLASTHRPDGSEQVTYNGKPLYTFHDDSGPGAADGNGVTDNFGADSFLWHAATVSGAASSPTTGGDPGYGY